MSKHKTYFDEQTNKQVSQQEYLYGKDVKLEPIPKHIIDCRVKALNKHLTSLLDHSFYTRDRARIAAVLKAIKYWENLNE